VSGPNPELGDQLPNGGARSVPLTRQGCYQGMHGCGDACGNATVGYGGIAELLTIHQFGY
jgi:hypothetical protein